MGTDREASLPIEHWDGVNLAVDSEDISPNQLLSAQNLWENKLGVLESRWGSETILYPGAWVKKIGKPFKIYKSTGEARRFCPVQCTPDVGVLMALPTGVNVSFADSAGGYWNKNWTPDEGITLSGTPRRLIFRFVGFGYDKMFEIEPSAVTGYNAGAAQKLVVEITNDFDNAGGRITGLEIYATVKCGSTETESAIDGESAYQEQTLWAGFINLCPVEAKTHDFNFCPLGYVSGILEGTASGFEERSFVVRAWPTGYNDVHGTFPSGKTYYVAVLPQYIVFDKGDKNRCCYRNPNVDVFGGNIVPVTIPGDSTGYITIESISPNTRTFLVAVGETPQTLQPYAVFNDSNGTGGFSTPPIVLPVGGFFGLEHPKPNNPGVIDIIYTADGEASLSFRFSDFSRQDMFMGFEDDGSIYPIFCSRLFKVVNDPDHYQDVVSDLSTYNGAASQFPWMWYSVNAMSSMQRLGDGSRYQFQSWQDHCFFVNDFNPLSAVSPIVVSSTNRAVMESRTGTNYFICDGAVAASVIEDWQSNTPTDRVTLPNMRYIAKFEDSIILGGGTPSIDPANGGVNDSSKTIYFSRALNPYNFTIPGATSPVHQTISVDDDGENISGFGIYSNTTSDAGPITQFLIFKRSATWIFTSLPTESQGQLSGFNQNLLSKRVGGFGDTVCNTPIGTIVASHDNVYLIRESGEPAPIGTSISPLLQKADMSRAVACYHDRHYKLSFSHPDYPGYNSGNSNNVEMWLNITKFIQKKGQEDWVGPMVGRAIDYVLIEDRDRDGASSVAARARIAVDTENGRIYKADVIPQESDSVIYDFKIADGDAKDSVVESVLLFKDFDITQRDNNWSKLIKRLYLKCRTNFAALDPSVYSSYSLWVDGELVSQDVKIEIPGASGDFSTKPLRLIPIFPQGRLNGRTVKLQFKFLHRIGIGGVQLNYQINRRRL